MNHFVCDWQEEMHTWFAIFCIVAGIIIAPDIGLLLDEFYDE